MLLSMDFASEKGGATLSNSMAYLLYRSKRNGPSFDKRANLVKLTSHIPFKRLRKAAISRSLSANTRSVLGQSESDYDKT
jgi:hypothetical protein